MITIVVFRYSAVTVQLNFKMFCIKYVHNTHTVCYFSKLTKFYPAFSTYFHALNNLLFNRELVKLLKNETIKA